MAELLRLEKVSAGYGETVVLENVDLAFDEGSTLALKPRVLLLDEPAAGVPSTESAVILDVVGALPGGIAVLIIEHDMELVFRFARRITVLVEGGILTEGTPAEIAADARVREVYLGQSSHGRGS